MKREVTVESVAKQWAKRGGKASDMIKMLTSKTDSEGKCYPKAETMLEYIKWAYPTATASKVIEIAFAIA